MTVLVSGIRENRKVREIYMQKKVRNYIEKFHMVEKGDRVLAAVSGGADSLCLLTVLYALREELGFSLCAIHVEHGIRGEESLRDAAFVEQICRDHQIPCRVSHCFALEYARAKKLTVEEAARELRYQLFAEAAKEFGANKIAVAHNQNDCAETMLFYLARGTGLKGLCGIPPVRGRIIRPLLCVSRQEIEDYLARERQDFCTDKTNEELLYTRNKIRHQVLPRLVEINANAISHMSQTAGFVAEAVELIQELRNRASEKYVSTCEEGICISEELLLEPPMIQRETLLGVLAEMAESSKDISSIHVQQLLELFARQNGRIMQLPYEICARRTYQGILLERGNTVPEERQPSWTLLPGDSMYLPSHGYEIHTQLLEKFSQNEEIPKKMYTKWFDYDKIKGTMRLRTRQEQDYLVIDAKGSRKKLKKYFVDEKIPEYRRDHILLLADDTHILWVIGHRISEDIKVTEHTRRILEIQIDGGRKSE